MTPHNATPEQDTIFCSLYFTLYMKTSTIKKCVHSNLYVRNWVVSNIENGM